jgi:CMP/dCMP kinase
VASAAPLPAADVVAIDGPAGAGKSTIARRLAEDLGWAWLDTGAMYRAAACVALEAGVPLDDAGALARLVERLDIALTPTGRVRVGTRDVTRRIRSPEVTAAVSRVASVPAVRRVMVGHQRRFAAANGRIVAEGRDIGTVVFPDACVKIYLDADADERARRRLAQEAGDRADVRAVGRVKADLEARDAQDRSRRVAPLRAAPDAWRLDTTHLTLEQVFEAVRSHVRSRIPRRAGTERGPEGERAPRSRGGGPPPTP